MLVIAIVTYLSFVSSFNVDTDFPIVYTDSAKSSYFGYSLVLYPGRNDTFPSRIFIGAPRGNYSDDKIASPGVILKCEIKKPCQKINVIQSYSATDQILNDSWIGGSTDVNYKSGRVVTCAHRWIRVKAYDKGDYLMQGICYWFHVVNDSDVQPLIPLYERGRDILNGVYNYGQGQAGTSLHMPLLRNFEKGSYNASELLLGAPGVYNWDGTTILYKDIENSKPIASRLTQVRTRNARIVNSGSVNFNPFADKNIANATKTKETLAYDLLGYSSTSGYFYDKKTLYYVSGAPKSRNYHGKVLIYTFDSTIDKSLKVKQIVEGIQFGEYFGASLTAGDVNSDGFDDLIVGAPFNRGKKFNEGKVYIFLGGTKFKQTKDTISLSGNGINGQFGSCVQYLGDINSDGFGDLAISAPYEEEKSGVVYIYKGISTGVDINYCQRIVGKDIYPEILGFGISVSRAADIDYNGSPDIAIGAYLSGHVVILRTHPIAILHHKLSTFSSHVDISQETFNVSTCFWFIINQPVSNITIRRTLTVDEEFGRATLKNAELVENITIAYKETVCRNITINIENIFSNQSDPLTISLAQELITQEHSKHLILISENGTNGTDLFCSKCPLYDKFRSATMSTLQLPFALGCGSDNICVSSLEFEPVLNDLSEDYVFVLGSKHTLTLSTVVKNVGENAYFTELVITFPEVVGFQSTPSNCRNENSSSITCLVDNLLKNNTSKTVTLDLDMTEVNNGYQEDYLNFTVTVRTSSENNLQNTKYLLVKLRCEADVTISKKSKDEVYSYKESEKNSLNFVQTYLVETFGRSSVGQLSVEIDVPQFIKSKKGVLTEIVRLYPVTGTVDDQESVFCRSNITFVDTMELNTDENEDSVMMDDNERIKRSLPEANFSNNLTNETEGEITEDNKYNFPANVTFFLNCSNSDVVCSRIICVTGAMKSGQLAKIDVDIRLKIPVVKNFLHKNNIIQYTTRGRVRISDPPSLVQSDVRPDVTEISSFFIGENVKEMVSLWIILLSVITGLLLLLLLILGLVKAGFFRRKTKEDLQQLKKEYEFKEEPNHL